MKEENTPQEEETENIIDLGTNTVFEVTYKTIKCADGRTYTVAQREIVEPELPPRKKAFRKGPGRPKKVKPVEEVAPGTIEEMEALTTKNED